ncbi:hypothetical protein ACQ7CX_18780 [Chryseobacterium arthrosphaerae]|uniref:hypothetical protein n=2 Tax=Chryseobacterium arthrosphaerae TaxID=651561 RepID=UPI001BB08D1B|nr:hypothetical protein [Chryseobacterium arthrosphaerae]QUY55709.1 hypothetical protein I2F65_23170 [Chryseobacterium arthrosphaerae]
MIKSFITTAAIFFGMCLVYMLLMLSETENYFTYILDDAYIHLAIARNFAQHGVWGVTEYMFSSSSSSPAFTLILSGLIYISGNNELIPLIFNFVCVLFIIYFLNAYYGQYYHKNKRIAASIFTLLFTSVHLLLFSGMEHVLQVMIIVINIFSFEKWLKSEWKNSYHAGWFCLSLAILGLIRFESMFYFLGLSVVALLLKKVKLAVQILIFGFVPILIFGYFTYQHTGYLFPNSVLIKGLRFDFSGNYFQQILDIFLFKIVYNPYFYNAALFPLLISVYMIAKDIRRKLGFQELITRNFLLIAWIITLLMHSIFSQLTNFYRYEAYILTGFAMALVPGFQNIDLGLKQNRLLAGLTLSSFAALALKIGIVSFLIVIGSRNIYEQQIQSARFLKKYYEKSKVVANDIGAICYFTKIHLFDFVGLGSQEIVPFRMRKNETDDEIETFLTGYLPENGYQLAIAYEEWLDGHVPENWKKVAELKIKGRSAVLGKKHLFIYAIDPGIYNSLKQNVKNFKWNKNVIVTVID